MTGRLETIFGELPECRVFADIGCDHGYIAHAMIKSGKCEKAIISDISEKCLNKAITLLNEDCAGKFEAVVSDGFEKVRGADLALIAGMGGEIICNVLTRAETLPEKLVLQPMKNAEKVRLLVINSGYKILKDYTFKDVKFYDLIVAEKGKDKGYDERELLYGRDNLKIKSKDFLECVAKKRGELILARDNAADKSELDRKIAEYSEILDEL